MFLLGGSTAPYSQFRKFNAATLTWMVLPNLPNGNARQSAMAALDGELYVFGSATSLYTQARKLNPRTLELWVLADCPAETRNGAAAVIDGEFYVTSSTKIYTSTVRAPTHGCSEPRTP